MYILEELNAMKVADLKAIAQELNIKKFDKLKKQGVTKCLAKNHKTFRTSF